MLGAKRSRITGHRRRGRSSPPSTLLGARALPGHVHIGSIVTGSAGRRRALRRQVTGWAIVAIVSLWVHHVVAGADSARAAWTGERKVVVLRAPVAAGHRIDAGDVEAVRMPSSLSPTDAVDTLTDGATAAVELRSGTVLGRSMIGADRRGGAVRSLGPGRVAVVVRTGDLPTPAGPGDVVDVASPGWDAPVATAARVLRIDGDVVTLGVGEDEATATATAGLSGPVALVLRP